jgi:hypothetical protein
MKTSITYLILAVIITICISCESHEQPVMNIPTSEYVTGQYAIVMYNREDKKGDVMCGDVVDGYVNTKSIKMEKIDTVYCIYENLDKFFYYVEFIDDSTLTLIYEKKMIGHNKKNKLYELKKDDSEPSEDYLWNYKVLNDSSLVIYYPCDEKTDYVLFTYEIKDKESQKKKNVAGVTKISKDWASNAFWLFPNEKN